MSKKTIVIFSHGFGVRSGSYWLFSDLIKEFDVLWIEFILTEYCDYDETKNEVWVKPFSEQAKILQTAIDITRLNNPDSNIILIWQSQWSTIISLCDTSWVNKIIMIAPFFYTNKDDVITRYGQNPWTTIDLENLSYRKRTDGTTTIIPSNYRYERFDIDIIDLYNKKAIENKLYIFYGLQDQVMKFEQYDEIKNTFIMNLDGDHDFNNQNRQPLIDKILSII